MPLDHPAYESSWGPASLKRPSVGHGDQKADDVAADLRIHLNVRGSLRESDLRCLLAWRPRAMPLRGDRHRSSAFLHASGPRRYARLRG
jgi:hypothetical protein